jgi:mono/diheme cytochrome c family protein
MRREWLALVAGMVLAAGAASAYPGGTPAFQTDAAPYCAACHSSRSEAALSGAPEGRAAKEMPESKHLALIQSGQGEYGKLTPEQRGELAAHIRAVDSASTVAISAPATVAAGATFQVTVDVTGGAGPVVGIGLVDLDHRWLARPAPSAGWLVVEPPKIHGQDFLEQKEWLAQRPEPLGRNLAFVNVKGISSDAVRSQWGRAQVIWTLRAPTVPGRYPLAAAYWYGTEKASPHGVIEDPVRGKLVRGGLGGASGRVMFSELQRIEVTAP